MPLYTINDFYSGYRNNPAQFDIRNFEIYNDRNEHLGRVIDTLLDQTGNLQYLIVELGGRRAKQVLLSVQQAYIDPQNRYIYLNGLSPRQVDRLPAYHSGTATPVSSEPVQPIYQMRSLEDSAPLEASAPLEGYYAPAPVPPPVPSPQPPIPPYTPPPVEPAAIQPPAPPAVEYFTQSPEVVPSPSPVVPPAVAYSQPPRPEAIVPPPAPTSEVVQEEVIPLREERLIVDQKKRKVGEVVVRKEIETEIIEVPIQREKLIVEQVGAEPKQLAEIDLTEDQFPSVPRQEVQLPRIPRHEP